MFPADPAKCKNLTVKFNGFLAWKRPIEEINETTWIINQHELVPDLFRQFGPSISTVSVHFDGCVIPSSNLIINHTVQHCTESMKSFELWNWQPRTDNPKSLMALDIRPLSMVHELRIYDSGWSSVMMQQINRIFPNLQRLKLLRNDFEDRKAARVECLVHLKELEIQCQLQGKYLQNNIFGILNAHRKLEHVTLSMKGTQHFWQKISQKLTSLPSLKLGYLPKTITDCNGRLTFHNETVRLVISPNIEQFGLKFYRLKELTLSDADHAPMKNNRDSVTMWLDFIIENKCIEKLNVFVARWFEKEHLTIILKNLPRLAKLAILGCDISMSNIVETLFFSQSIEKLHLISYRGAIEMIDSLEWTIKKDKNNNVLIKKSEF